MKHIAEFLGRHPDATVEISAQTGNRIRVVLVRMGVAYTFDIDQAVQEAKFVGFMVLAERYLYPLPLPPVQPIVPLGDDAG